MPRKTWLLEKGQPVIHVELHEPMSGFTSTRILLADTGAGAQKEPVDFVLSKLDGARFGEFFQGTAHSSGAIPGQFAIFVFLISIPALNFHRRCNGMLVPAETLPDGLDGIATFRFLNSFSYGNFGNPREFGLET